MEQARLCLDDTGIRGRILRAAFELFLTQGYARTSTLAIARRAHVSKRDLYALFGGKRGMLESAVRERGVRMSLPEDLPPPTSTPVLLTDLIELGSRIMWEVTRPEVLALQRLAVAESDHAPEIAWVIETNGRQPTETMFTSLFAAAQTTGAIGPGDPVEMARRMLSLMWGSLLLRLLMRTIEAPEMPRLRARAQSAAETVLRLYPPVSPAASAPPGTG